MEYKIKYPLIALPIIKPFWLREISMKEYDGMQQNIYIVLRGQSYNKLDKINIQNDIIKKSNNIIDANNIIFLEGK